MSPSSRADLRRTWDEQGLAVGTMVTMPGGAIIEVLVRSGCAFLLLDRQHGYVGPDDVLEALRVSGGRVPMFVRTSTQRPDEIGYLLDVGADGIIVPDVRTAAEAEAVVQAFSYPPAGRRSYGPIRSGLLDGDWAPGHHADRALRGIMVESVEAFEEIEAIARCDVDLILAGPADLALSLGSSPEGVHENADVTEHLRRLVKVCKQHDRLVGIQALGAKDAVAYRELGFDVMSVGFDWSHLLKGALREIGRVTATDR